MSSTRADWSAVVRCSGRRVVFAVVPSKGMASILPALDVRTFPAAATVNPARTPNNAARAAGVTVNRAA
jgi:hypothetical protein